MNTPTLIEQEIAEFDKQFNCKGLLSCQMNPMEIKDFLRTFASRILESAGEQIIEKTDTYYPVDDKNHHLAGNEIELAKKDEQRTKLQELKEVK